MSRAAEERCAAGLRGALALFEQGRSMVATAYAEAPGGMQGPLCQLLADARRLAEGAERIAGALELLIAPTPPATPATPNPAAPAA